MNIIQLRKSALILPCVAKYFRQNLFFSIAPILCLPEYFDVWEFQYFTVLTFFTVFCVSATLYIVTHK